MSRSPAPGQGFADLPPAKAGASKYDWEAIDRACRAQPTEWYQVFSQDKNSLVSSLRQGSVRRMAREHGYEYSTRNNTEVNGIRHCDLYVRYNPDLDQHRKSTRKARKS